MDLEDYGEIYGDIDNTKNIACLLRYPEECPKATTIKLHEPQGFTAGKGMAVVGAGNFTRATILPILKELRAPVRTVISSAGVSGTHLAQKYGVPESSTDFEASLKDDAIGTVLITTRHNLHAAMT